MQLPVHRASELAAVAALNPDVAIVHAQRADRAGNVQLWGITGVQKEAVLAARRALVTVEELVDELAPVPGAVVLPSWVLDAVAVAPGGAAPSYAHGYYDRDNAAYRAWDAHQPGPGGLLPLAAHDRGGGMTGTAEPVAGTQPASTWTADEMMTIAAARALRDGQACFVGIGLPSTAANLARRLHAPRTWC